MQISPNNFSATIALVRRATSILLLASLPALATDRSSHASAIELERLALITQAATTTAQPATDSYTRQFTAELDSLLRVGVNRPYGLAWSDAPEAPQKNAPRNAAPPIVSFEPSHTPAAGLILHLGASLLAANPDTATDAVRFREAALAVARALQSSADSNGRVPSFAAFPASGVTSREPYGTFPRRDPTTAALGFLLLLDRDLPTRDARVSSTAVRFANWLLKQQLRPGVFSVSAEFPGEKYPKRIVRLDLPDTRDGTLAFLLISLCAEGRDTSLPGTQARLAADRGIQQLLLFRISDLGKASRHLWPTAFDMNGAPVTALPELPPAGNLLASRYAVQTLLAYHLATSEITSFDAAKLSAEALANRKNPEGAFPLIDDPNNKYPPPAKPASTLETFTNPLGQPTWPTGDFGITGTLRTTSDLRVLGPATFSRLTSRTIPADLALAAVLTGLTDQLPTADLPLSAAQIPPFRAAHPELFSYLDGPEPVELAPRVKRLYALYLLATWERRFAPGNTPPTPSPNPR